MDVCPLVADRLQFLAVSKNPPRDGFEFDALRTGVRGGGGEEVIECAHGATIGNPTANVNGYLTGNAAVWMRSDYRAMLTDVLRRVETRLEALGLSPTAASKQAGLSGDAIRNLQRAAREGRRQGVSTRTITALAPVLETNIGWLLNGEGDPDEARTTDSVAVVGYVSAGASLVRYGEGQGPFDYVAAPRHSTPSTVAAAVRGTSLGPAFDEAVVFYDDVRSPITPDLHGRLCVVGLADGRVLVKIVRPGEEGRYHLISNTAEEPLWNEEIAWAARVTDVRPR